MLTTEQARDIALKHVQSNANLAWLAEAKTAVETLAATQQPFTTDDVWDIVDVTGHVTHEPRAMGPVIRSASKQGLIRPTGLYRNSKRVECHARPMMVWIGSESS
jgi:hypothetical protein